VSSGDTGKETSRTEAGARNKTEDGRVINSDIVTRLCGENMEETQKNVISADTKYLMF